ncbi:MAG: hypothetical protein PHS04_07080 [Tissierellia bacterium]|nr:hypothetical protein [Tissierellia bacterium]
MATKSRGHIGEPRNVAFDEARAAYYSTKRDEELSYIRSGGDTIFAGSNQVELFLMCMALAKYANKSQKELKKRVNNIPTNAMGEGGKWLILALGIVDNKALTCLNDEGPLYIEAEKYAEAGFEVLQSLLTFHGRGFGEFLEITLRKIAESNIE